MVEILAWLETLELSRYGPKFIDNGIGRRALSALSDQDLKDIGVAALGHRRVLLAAIKALEDDRHGASGAAAPERRQITIMFCDLVGPAALSEQLDPEDLPARRHAYQQACGTVIESYDGHVAQYLGDGMMVYFGWPQSHEDDAIRAVRAGLDIVGAVKRVEAADPLHVRIGIATGHVVVGATGAGDAAGPNLAARLQGVAAIDEIVIAPATRRLIGDSFELDDLGDHALKGIIAPVRAWRATGVARTEGRFEAAHGVRLTPMVGRDAEIAMILERWKRAATGEGQVVLLSGEAGIGKSRVVQRVREYIALEPHIDLRYQCSPFHVNSALHPIIEHFERIAEFDAKDSAEEKRDKLNAVLERSSEAATYMTPLFASLLSLDVGADQAQPTLSPQLLKETTLEALNGQVLALTARRPVLMVFEDTHWIDPTSQDLLNRLVADIPSARVMLLLTSRPGYQAPWTDHRHVLPMTLTRLGRAQAADMVEKVAGGTALPKALLDQILSQTDGVPLYVEELTKSVLESGLAAPSSTAETGEIAITASLQDSLMVRLDRLGAAKKIAQICACIGREFSLDVLQVVAEIDAEELSQGIDRLLSSGLILRSERSIGVWHGFKHGLVHEAAYNSLIATRRRDLHRRIADVLRRRFDETGDGKPEDVAHHFTQCGDFAEAVRFWHIAGERSSARSAHSEAIAQFRAALDSLGQTADDRKRADRELALELALGPSLMSIKGWADPEVRKVYARASALAREIGTPTEVFTATWGQWLVNQQFGQIDYAAELSRQVLALAEPLHESGYLLQAHHAAWTTRFRLAEFETCRVHADQGIALYNAREHVDHVQQYGGHDPGVCARFHSGMSLWMLGFPSQAIDRVRDSVDLAANIAHPFSRAHAGFHAAQLHKLRREPALSLAHAEEVSRIAAENDFSFIRIVGQALEARALSAQGHAARAIPKIENSIQRLRDSQVGARLSYFLSLLVAALVEGGELEGASAAVDEAMKSLSEHGEMTWVAEVYRLKGCVLHKIDAENDPEAEIWLRRALDLAGEQDAKSWQLRAATDLALLSGRGSKSPPMPAPCWGRSTTGSPRASTPRICETPRDCSTNFLRRPEDWYRSCGHPPGPNTGSTVSRREETLRSVGDHAGETGIPQGFDAGWVVDGVNIGLATGGPNGGDLRATDIAMIGNNA